MPRRSSIKRLDPRIRETVDKLVRDGRATIDQIVDRLEAMLGEEAPSRSSVGRYVKDVREQMKIYRQAQEMAKVWVGTLEEDPDSDVGQLLSHMLRTISFQQMSTLGMQGEDVDPKDIMFLSSALKNIAGADKIMAERELRIRKEAREQAAEAMATEAKRQGASATTIDSLRAAIMRELTG